jgi:enterochelin esterase-like enzyme
MKYSPLNKEYLISVIITCISSGFCNLEAQEDHSHFSSVFNREKPYRIFLPADYHKSEKRYPVIYYFHGNTGNHMLDIEGVSGLVDQNSVILVAWNGRSVESDIRPYNIGNHSNIKYEVQFKDYFREFIDHIDNTYRTLPDRKSRGTIGHSMGGIMSFFLAGKYPDLIGAAYSSKGSPEFFIGTPSRHSLFQVRHMFRNMSGIKVGFSTSNECELYYLNNEVINGGLNETGIDFSYTEYKGSHDITPEQFKDAFNFVVNAFKNPLPVPSRWHHADLYPDFEVWGYEVKSNIFKPGFIDLKGVTKSGLTISTKAWMPDGPVIPGTVINIITPSAYLPQKDYTLIDYNQTTNEIVNKTVRSDTLGRISFEVNHEVHQAGIFRKGDPPEITLAGYRVNGSGLFLDHNKESSISIKLFNRGGSRAENIKAVLTTEKDGVSITKNTVYLKRLEQGDTMWVPMPYKVTASNNPPKDGSPFRIRFNLSITDAQKQAWVDEFDAPVFFEAGEFTQIGIDDGDSEIFGSGNGNNIAEPGETVMIYEISNGSRRLRLYYDDPYIDGERLYDEIQPDKWGDGYSLSSLIHIAENCPTGHKIRFLAYYEVKDWKKIRRDVTWGTFSITIGDPVKK